jgi:hypothetical protein
VWLDLVNAVEVPHWVEAWCGGDMTNWVGGWLERRKGPFVGDPAASAGKLSNLAIFFTENHRTAVFVKIQRSM